MVKHQLPGPGTCRDLAATIKKAFHIARTGRPGYRRRHSKDGIATPGFSYPATVQRCAQCNPCAKGHGDGQIHKRLGAAAANRPSVPTSYRRRGGAGQCRCQNCASSSISLGYPATHTFMGLERGACGDPRFHSACWAYFWHLQLRWPCRTATCCWPYRPYTFRRPRDRQSGASRRWRARSSTSTSIPRPF